VCGYKRRGKGVVEGVWVSVDCLKYICDTLSSKSIVELLPTICCVFVVLNLVNPDFIIIMYHQELRPNSYEMTQYLFWYVIIPSSGVIEFLSFYPRFEMFHKEP
jgi:hypothetical protein